MKQITEEISYQGKLIALIIHPTKLPPGVHFVSPLNSPLQVGTIVKKKNEHIRAHTHNEPVKTVRETQEVLCIEKGKLKMYLYAPNGKLIYEGIIKTGDKVMLASGGHGFDVLEDTVIFEVKQGPYPGYEKAKKYLEAHRHDSG